MSDHAKLTEWVEKFKEPFPTSYLESVFGAPLYARETLTERIEPYYTLFNELEMQHPLYWSDGHDSEPDPEWYTPTPKLLALDAEIEALRAKAFREVSNPDYDRERAEAWQETRRNRFNQTRIEIGQSYHPPIE